MKKISKNPLYPGNIVWGQSPEWLDRQKAYLDKNQGKPINSFAVFKEANNRWRWITLSSSAFRDQDKEIVSTKALENDVVRADRDRDYGPLRWWHVNGADLGDCDFNMLHDHVLIESGTFKSAEIAKAIGKAANGLGVSIGFYHPITEPDHEGVFHNIRRFERSLLPKDVASNALTALVVKTKEITNMTDEKRKIAELQEIVGAELAEEILSNARLAEKSAIDGQIEFKSAEKEDAMPDDEIVEDEEMPEGLTEEEKCAWLNKKKPKKEKSEGEIEDEVEDEAETEKETVILKRPKRPEEEQPAQASQAQPQAKPLEALQQQAKPAQPADYERAESEPVAQRPAKAAVQAEEKAEPAPPQAKPAPQPAQPAVEKPAQPEQEYEEVEMEEVPLPEVIGNMTIEEFGELLASALSEALMPYLQTVKEAKAELEKARTDLSVSVKEKEARDEETKSLKEKVSQLSVALEKAAEKIADLSGDIPAVAKPYVASESNDTIIDETDSLKEYYPREDSFVDWLVPKN